MKNTKNKIMTYRLEEEIARDLKIYAAENNISVQSILESYIKKILENKGERKNERLYHQEAEERE